MTALNLMNKLNELAGENPDIEVEVRVISERDIEAEMTERADAGEEIIVDGSFDEYTEDFSLEMSKCGCAEKICIIVRI